MYPELKRSSLLLVMMLLGCSILFAQQRTVSGVILNRETHEPLPGATVSVKGTDRMTATDERGQFKIIASDESVLKITMVGFVYQEIPVGKQNNFTLNLDKDNKSLDEVVVVGYGTQKRAHLTGAVGTVDMKKIEDLPVGTLSEALRGQIVGVGVSGGFSRPGEPATITIRNPIYFSKDGGSKEPLYVIDDIIRTKSDFDLLDATEIDNISVLKDAAAAIYGILGSNGVIIVKTKRGRAGQTSISYNASYGISDAPMMPKMMSGYQQAQYINDYLLGSKNYDTAATYALSGYYTPDEMEYFKTQNYNWLQQAWQKAYDMRHTLNISGGTEKATFFAGFTYSDQNSNFDGLGYKRYSFRSSSDIKLATGLKLGLSLSGALGDRKNTFNKQGNESLDNDWKTLIGESSLYAPYKNGLPILIQGAGTSSNINTYHYFAVHNLDNYTSSYNTGLNFQGQLNWEIPFVKGLTAGVNYNKNIANSWGKQYGTKYQVYDFNKLGTHSHILGDSVIKSYTWTNGDRVRLNPTITTNYQLNTTLNYDRQFGKHSINLLAGYEQSETNSDGVAGSNEGVVIGGLDNQNFALGTTTNPDGSTNETISEAGRMAYIGRLNYNYASKYLLELNFRADASQNFAPENRWGYFPSGSIGWVVSEEPFFNGALKFVNYLKLRASVGFLGLDATKSYQWLRSYALQTGKAAIFGGNDKTERGNAVVMNIDMANRDVHWDNVDKYNAGADLRFLKNRLNLSVDAFIDKRSNMLSNLTAAPSILIGTPIPSENFGKVNTFGFEGSANWRDNINKNWSYNITANFSWYDNKVLVKDVAKGDIGTFKDPTGKSSDMGYYGYKYLGMFRTQADIDNYVKQYNITNMLGYTVDKLRPGMLYFADIRGKLDPTTGLYGGADGIIDVNDQDFLRSKAENHYGLGLNWGISYKTLSLNVISGMSWGGIGAVESSAVKLAQVYSNRPVFWSDHWTPDNVNAAYPNPYWTSTYDLASNFWWRSSFTFRVQSLNLSYSLPQSLVRKAGFNSARIYLVGTNPFNFYNPYDYKDNANGSYDVFPQLRTYTVGLNFNL
jgi:TonB-linked SusC/RagA family outer membrane protein